MLNKSLFNSMYLILLNESEIGKSTGFKLNLVESCFSSVDYYDQDIDKLASVYRSVIKNHAFLDGNKRTATLFLQSNLLYLEKYIPDELLYKLAIDVASNNYEVLEISKMIQSIWRSN